MVSKFVLSNFLLASAALAAPSSQQEAPLVRRQENHQSQPVSSVPLSTRDAPNLPDLNQYCGGAVVAIMNGSFTSVTGTFTMPALSGSRGNNTSGFSMQVGIDSYNCSSGFQIGFDVMFKDGVTSYSAWYDTKLNTTAKDFPSPITINAHDVLEVTINSGTPSMASIENHTTPQKVNMTFDANWCGTDVVWLVGKNKKDNNLPLTNFGMVIISNTSAIDINRYWNTEDGVPDLYSPINHTAILNIVQGENALTFTNVVEDGILVQYYS